MAWNPLSVFTPKRNSTHRTASRAASHKVRRRSAAILTVEQLEDRVVPAQFIPGDIAVINLAAASNNTTASILELNPSTANQASPVQTIPIASTGTNAMRFSDSGTSSFLSDTNDRTLLSFTGYNTTDTTDSDLATSPLTDRTVVTLDANANFTLQTSYTGISGNQTRSTTSLDDSNWFIADKGGLYSNGETAPTNATNILSAKSFGGTVYISSTRTTVPSAVVTVASPTATTFTGLTGVPIDANIQDFYLIQSGSNGSTYDILYTMDAGQINKFSLVSGTWTANGSYTIPGGGGQSMIAANNGSGGASLYLTTSATLDKFTDTAGFNATINVTTANNVTLYTATSPSVLKGMDFVPVSGTTGTATTTAVTSISPLSTTANTPVTFTATVTASTGTTAPTAGSVRFYNGGTGGTLLATATSETTSGTVATFTVSSSSVPVGTYNNITAVYGPGTGFASSTSSAFGSTLTITANATTTAITSISPLSAAANTPVNFSATVTASTGTTAPTAGSVEFFNGGTGGTLLATATSETTSGTVATFTVSSSSVPIGTYNNIQAFYVPGTGFASSNSTVFGSTLTITGAATTTAITSISPLSTTTNTPVAFTATVTASTGTTAPTAGSVEFFNGGTGGTLLATATSETTSGTVATFTVSSSSVPIGTYNNIQAFYVPGTGFASSNSSAFGSTLTISPNSFTPGNLVVLQVNDGTTTYASDGPVYLREITTSGTTVQTVPVPNNQSPGTGTGNQPLTLDTGTTSNANGNGVGILSRSLDSSVLTFAGNDANVNTGSISTGPASTNRVLAQVGVNPTTLNTTTYGPISQGDDIRGVVEANSTTLYSFGHTTNGGLRYVNGLTTGGGTTGIMVSGTETGGDNTRAATVAFNGQVFYSSAKTSPVGIYESVNAGGNPVFLPTTAGTATSDKLLVADPAGGNPNGLFVADMNGDGVLDNGDKMYFVDAATGLYSSTYNGTTWSTATLLSNPMTANANYVGLTGQVISSTEVKLFFTSSDGSGNSSVFEYDDGGTNTATTLIALAPATDHGESLPGIAFAPLNPTTLTLTAPSNANPNQNVTFTATVSSANGTPVGSVYFIDDVTGALLNPGGSPISGGTATFSTTALPLGVNSVHAYFAGDSTLAGQTANIAAATSAEKTVTVTGSTPSTATVTAPTSSSTIGESVTFTATVAPTTPPGPGVPTGTVTFLDGSSTLGTMPLSNGTATFTTANLTLGTHSITVSYSGDANYLNATSSVDTFAVNPGAAISVSSASNTTTPGSQATLTATVSGNGLSGLPNGSPTGTVTFFEDLSGSNPLQVGTATLTGTGNTLTANLTTTTAVYPSGLTAGSHLFYAVYNPDTNSNYVTVTSSNYIETAQKAFTPGDIVVLRRGDGNSKLTSAATQVYLDEYTTSGTLVQSIALPNADSGNTHILSMSGTAGTQGFLSLSANGAYLTLAGYDLPLGTASATGSNAATVARVIGRVDDFGNINTDTLATEPNNDAFLKVKGAVSNDGQEFYLLGDGSTTNSGIAYTTLGASGTPTQVGPNNSSGYAAEILGGQLYVATEDTTSPIEQVGTGLPTSASSFTAFPGLEAAYSTLPGFNSNSTSVPAPYAFLLFNHLTGLSTGNADTLYVADQDFGLLKFANTTETAGPTTGTWVLEGQDLATNSPGGVAEGLTGKELNPGTSGYSFQMYLTANAAFTGGAGNQPNYLYSFTDTSAYNAPPDSYTSFQQLALAPTGGNFIASFAGVAFVPLTPTTTTLSSSAPNASAGANVTLKATVTPTVAGTLQGTVTFFADGVQIGSPATVTGGVATTTFSTLVIGSHTITATYSGDSNDQSSNAAPLTQTIGFNTGDLVVERVGNGAGGTITAATESTNTVTITTQTANNLLNGQQVKIAGVSLAGYNGTFTITVLSATQFTYTDTNSGLTPSSGGTVTSLTDAANAVYLDEFSTSGTSQTAAATLALPTAVSGTNQILTDSTQGFAINDGMLTESADSQHLTLIGYDATIGTSKPEGTPTSTTPRIVGLINANGTVNTSTEITDGYSTGEVPASYTLDGSSFYVSGFGSGAAGGVRLVPLGSPGSSTSISTTFTNTRGLTEFDGQLYLDAGTTGIDGPATVGTGLPTSSGQVTTPLGVASGGGGFPTTRDSSGNFASPYQFVFADPNTVYITDNRTDGLGGIQKWVQSVSNTWVETESIDPGNIGFFGLGVDLTHYNSSTGAGAVLYATTYDTTGTGGNSLVTVSDNGTALTGYTVLATAPANESFRGVTFAPTNPGTATSTISSLTVDSQASDTQTYGNTVTFSATVSGAGATPSGVVSFQVNGKEIGSAPLIAGVAAFTESLLLGVSGSPYQVKAVYTGDSSYAPTTSASSVQLTVTPAPTTITVTASPSPGPSNSPITLTATVASTTTGTPGGTVTFFEQVGAGSPTQIGTTSPTVNSSGVATLSNAMFPNAGTTYLITATFTPDNTGNWQTSTTTSPFAEAIGDATSTTVAANSVNVGSTVTLTATVTDTASPTHTPILGTVNFYADGLSAPLNASPVSVSGSGASVTASTTVNTALLQATGKLTPGIHTITAVFTPSNSTWITSTGLQDVTVNAQPWGAGDLLVYRNGDGTTALNGGTGDNVLYVDEYTTSGTLVQSIIMPSADSATALGPNNTVVPVHGVVADSEHSTVGQLSLSGDGQYAFLEGYDAPTTFTSSVSSASATTVPRSIARIGSDGSITTVALKDYSGAFSSVYSPDGSTVYVSGGGGIREFAWPASPPSSTITSTSIYSVTSITFDSLEGLGGNLFTTGGAPPSQEVAQVGTGFSTSSVSSLSPLPGLSFTSSMFPIDAYATHLNGTGAPAGINTLYVSDDGPSFADGTITKWTLNTAGTAWSLTDTYTATGTLANLNTTPYTFYWIQGQTSGTGGVTMYVTSGNGGTSNDGGGQVMKVVDNSGYGGTFSTTSGAVSVVAYVNSTTSLENFRGVAFVPTAITTTTITNSTPNPSTTSQSVTFTVTVSGGSTTSNNGESITLEDASNGNAVVPATGTLLNGTATLTVAAGALSVGTHNIFAVYGGDGSHQPSQSTTVAQKILTPTTTTLTDNGPNPSTAGQTVNFLVSVSGSPANGESVTLEDASNGNAVVGSGMLTSGSVTIGVSTLTAGTHNIFAVYGGDANLAGSQSTQSTQTVNLGAPASVTVVSGSAQSGTVNSAFASPLKVIVKDSVGDPLPGVSVTFAGPGGGPGGSFSNGFAGIGGITDSTGQLSEAFTANTIAGTYSVEAFVNGVSTPAVFSLTNTAGAAASIVVTSGSNQSALVSSTFASPLVATVKDTYGNLVPNVTVTFAGPGSGASVTFPSGATATTGSNGQASVAVAANGVVGSYSVTASTSGVGTPASFSLTNTPNDLFVTSFTQTPSGFTVAFSKPFVDSSTSPLHLYDAASAGYGPAEVTLVGQNSGAITGSLLVNSSNTGFTFIKTDPTYGGSTAGLLPADSYTVTLVSGSNALRDTSNVPLDGQDNGGSANYVTTFTVTASSAVVVSVPDFARGPDSAHAINLPNNSTNGIPIALSNGAGVTSGTLTLQYNASLLNVTGATTTLSGATFTLDAASTPGNAILDFSSSTALGSGAVILGSLQATVPSGAAYKSKALLHWSSTVLMAGTTPLTTVGDDGVQVVAFLGNTTGSGTYTSADSVLLTRATSGVDSGFAAFPVVDPVILGDIAGAGIGKTSGTDKLTSADATLLNRYLNGTTVAQMPTYPGAPSNNPTGPDPVLSLPSQVQIGPGSTVTVPVNIDDPHPAGSTGMTEATLALTYDPKVLQVLPGSIRLGTVPAAGTDWTLQSAVNATTGQIGITLFSATPISSSLGGSLVTLTFQAIPGTSVSSTTVSLVSAVDPTGKGTIATEVYDNQGPYTLSLPEAGSGSSLVETVSLTGIPVGSADTGFSANVESISASRILQGTLSNQTGSASTPTEPATWALETLDWKNQEAVPGWLPVASLLTSAENDTSANDQVFQGDVFALEAGNGSPPNLWGSDR